MLATFFHSIHKDILNEPVSSVGEIQEHFADSIFFTYMFRAQ